MGTQVTTKLGDWNTDENYVAQAMESAMYASANADDTLVLVGPPRMPGDISELKAVGVLQNFSVTQQRAVQPHQAIGSARTFFQASKTNVQGNIGRLFVNGKNLYRALYDNMYSTNGDYLLDGKTTENTDLLPHAKSNTDYVVALDSRMFLIPFGMAVIYRDKLQNDIGGIYIEMMVLPNWSTNITAGSPTLVEGTSFLADRVLPLNTSVVAADRAQQSNAAFNESLAGGDSDLKNRLNTTKKS